MVDNRGLIDSNEAVSILENNLSIIRQMDTNGNMQKYIKLYEEVIDFLKNRPTVDAVEVEKYMALREMYHDLRENFIDYVCSGTCNTAPYCLNRCEECVDKRGWCEQGSDKCHGFNPAEIILMDGDGNG
jgi:hypothetical protein